MRTGIRVSDTSSNPFREGEKGTLRREASGRASSYLFWMIILSFLAELILIDGVVLLKWRVEDFVSREAAVALGIGLVVMGGVLLTITCITVWIKINAKEDIEKLRQLQGP